MNVYHHKGKKYILSNSMTVGINNFVNCWKKKKMILCVFRDKGDFSSN